MLPPELQAMEKLLPDYGVLGRGECPSAIIAGGVGAMLAAAVQDGGIGSHIHYAGRAAEAHHRGIPDRLRRLGAGQ